MNETTLVRQPEGAAAEDRAGHVRVPGLPRIGLMGEFSAGKTTLINFLLGEEILPVRVTATQMPPVWMCHGPRAAYYVDEDGERHDLDFDDLASLAIAGVRYVKVSCESDILKEFELFDTPGISDPNIPDHYRQAVVDFVDSVIWCTHAPQAWRESERSAWANMPDRIKETSILLATRADKLGARDRSRVAARLGHEAGGDFREIILFSTLDAIRSCQMDEGAALFTESGAERLTGALHGIALAIAECPQEASPGRMEPANPAQTGGVVVALQPAQVRPARVARNAQISRARPARDREPDREDAPRAGADLPATPRLRLASVGSHHEEVAPADDAAEGAITAQEAAVCDGLYEPPLAFATELHAEPAPDGDNAPLSGDAEAGDRAGALDLGAYLVTQEETDRDSCVSGPEEDSTAEDESPLFLDSISRVVEQQWAMPDVAEPDADMREIPDEDVSAGQGLPMLSASALWHEILAEEHVRSVHQLADAIARLLERLDQAGVFVPASRD